MRGVEVTEKCQLEKPSCVWRNWKNALNTSTCGQGEVVGSPFHDAVHLDARFCAMTRSAVSAPRRARLLLVDNLDSYTYNLAHLLASAIGESPCVVRADAYSSLAQCVRELGPFDGYVISPGPGTPHSPRDLRPLAAETLAQRRLPVLGVCLGHQALCALYGARVDRSTDGPAHGVVACIERTPASDSCPLWRGVPRRFKGVRYHSLSVVPSTIPDNVLIADAWLGDILMAVHHARYPLFGVQFHPESVSTEFGATIADNFYATVTKLRNARAKPWLMFREPPYYCDSEPPWRHSPQPENQLEVLHRRVHDVTSDTAKIFQLLYKNSVPSFWLDSADAHTGRSRFSLMGDTNGPLAEVITYNVETREVRISGKDTTRARVLRNTSIFDYLDDQLARRRVDAPDELPLDMNGGYVGYLGYELKADCDKITNVHRSDLPDAALFFADRLVVVDHQEDAMYLVTVHTRDEVGGMDARMWMNSVEKRLRDVEEQPFRPMENENEAPPPGFTLERLRDEYIDDIGRALDALDDGDSYEVCLTNRLRTTLPEAPDPLAVYLTLREHNPAPHSAYLRLSDDVAVCSSSPERFLRISDGTVESRPIKGTRARGATAEADSEAREELSNSDKDRRENLMIVDLVRNDLARVAVAGSVCVPALMAIETYAHVHQMVSVVRAQLRPECSTVDAVRNAFPMGSMTGAPKLRTMEIIDELECSARGVYSGAIGYLALGGAADLSVCIRTAVLRGRLCEIGVGGAIVALSKPSEEFDEIITKGRALMAAIADTVTGSGKKDYVVVHSTN